MLAWLEQSGQRPRRLLFVSSSGVYAQADGQWVDEDSPAEAESYSGRIMLEAERLARSSGIPATVVRLTGIYGPGREWLLKQVRMGYRVVSEPPLFANRIHAEDAAGLLAYLLQADARGVELAGDYLGVDDAPAPLHEVVGWLREALGVTEWAEESTVRRAGSKRCSNARARALGWRPLYPSYREGYAAVLKGPEPGRQSHARPPLAAGVELFHADFSGQPFGRHSHDAFAIGAILQGIGGYQCRGARHALAAGTLSLMNPEEPHTGHAISERLVYRMLYVEEARLPALLGRKRLPTGFTALNPVDDGAVPLAGAGNDRAQCADPGKLERACAMAGARGGAGEPGWGHDRLPARLPGGPPCRGRQPGAVGGAGAAPSTPPDRGVPPCLWRAAAHLPAAAPGARSQAPAAGDQTPLEVALGLGFYDQAHFSGTFKRFTGVTRGSSAAPRAPEFSPRPGRSQAMTLVPRSLEALSMFALFLLVAGTHFAALLSPARTSSCCCALP